MTNEQIKGLIRHALGIVGAILVTVGIITPEETAGAVEAVMIVAGSLMDLLALVWSFRAKIPNTKL
jgi:hypothetical protein